MNPLTTLHIKKANLEDSPLVRTLCGMVVPPTKINDETPNCPGCIAVKG